MYPLGFRHRQDEKLKDQYIICNSHNFEESTTIKHNNTKHDNRKNRLLDIVATNTVGFT